MKNIYFEISLKIARAYGEKIKELRQLRKENAELKQEIERLKQVFKPDFDNIDLETILDYVQDFYNFDIHDQIQIL